MNPIDYFEGERLHAEEEKEDLPAPKVYSYRPKIIEEEKEEMIYQRPGLDEPKKMFEYESTDHKPKYDPTGIIINPSLHQQQAP
jgi:hypothetical protein